MIMLSKLSRFNVVDNKGISAKFADLAVQLLNEDYPPVLYLFYKIENKIMRLSWEEVDSIDIQRQQILVSDFSKAQEVSVLENNNEYVLLQREILDALILDLQNRRAIRANDLYLEQEDGKLFLKGADTSFRAIIRRITLCFYNSTTKSGLYDWKYVEFLRGDPKAVKNGSGYNLRITRLSPGEIAQLTNFIPYLHAAELLTLLPDSKAVKTLEVMPVERQLQVFEELDEEQGTCLLSLMAPDTAADLMGHLQIKTMKRYLEKLPRQQSQRIIELLRYPEDSVGGIMTNDVVYLQVNLTVAEARLRLREHFQNTDFVYFIYIVDDNESLNLRGMISIRDLLIADDDKKLEEIMDPFIATFSPTGEAKAAAYRVVESQLAAMPVVGPNNKLIGAVTIDAAIMAVTPTESSENMRIFS